MEFKRNESTLNRPEGDRVLDAPYVFIDIPSYIDQVKQEKAWEKNDRNGITVYKSDRVTIVITALQAGAEIRENLVDGFFSIQLLRGKARISTNDGDINMQEGQILTFHPGVPHAVTAVTDAVFLLTNYSTDDKKEGTDQG